MTTSESGFPTVAMVGGGQLARMTCQAAVGLGVHMRVLALSREDSAAQVCPDLVLGDPDDPSALREAAAGATVVTFDHEHVPIATLQRLIEAGVAVRPGPSALAHAQDKLAMRERLSNAGLPCPAWRRLAGGLERTARVAVLEDFAAEIGWPMIIKTARGGYDGRGVWHVQNLEEALEVTDAQLPADVDWLLEVAVDFVIELSAQVARSPHGQAVAYPVVQTIQVDGMCREVIAPAPGLSDARATQAQRIALDVADLLGVTGMLAVELFDTGSELLINELAMRPHNSGHWSIEGAVTSQFENHLRAVLDLPLGSPAQRDRACVMVNIIGQDRDGIYDAYRHVMARDPGLKVHMYGKTVRAGRKLGHVTVSGEDVTELRARAQHAADYLAGVIDE